MNRTVWALAASIFVACCAPSFAQNSTDKEEAKGGKEEAQGEVRKPKLWVQGPAGVGITLKILGYEKRTLPRDYGVRVAKDHPLVISNLTKDSSAEKSILKVGDHITEIDGESTDDMSLTEAISKLRGEKNSKVKITFEHPDESGKTSAANSVTIARE